MIKLTRRDFIASTSVVILSPAILATQKASATDVQLIDNNYFQRSTTHKWSSGPTIRAADINVRNTYDRFSEQQIASSSPALANDMLSCGLAGYAVKSGLALTATGVASPLGIGLLISGSIGLAACTVNLTGHAISATFDVSNQGISDATAMVTVGGMAGALYSGLTGQNDMAVRNAKIGSSLESIFFGGAGIKTANGLVDFGVGQLELSKGLTDLIVNSYEITPQETQSENIQNDFNGESFTSSSYGENSSFGSDFNYETSFGSGDFGGTSDFEGSFGSDWSFESDFGSDSGGEFGSGDFELESPGLGEYNF